MLRIRSCGLVERGVTGMGFRVQMPTLFHYSSSPSLTLFLLLAYQDVLSQLLLQCHAFLPAAMLPAAMVMVSPSETVKLRIKCVVL